MINKGAMELSIAATRGIEPSTVRAKSAFKSFCNAVLVTGGKAWLFTMCQLDAAKFSACKINIYDINRGIIRGTNEYELKKEFNIN